MRYFIASIALLAIAGCYNAVQETPQKERVIVTRPPVVVERPVVIERPPVIVERPIVVERPIIVAPPPHHPHSGVSVGVGHGGVDVRVGH